MSWYDLVSPEQLGELLALEGLEGLRRLVAPITLIEPGEEQETRYLVVEYHAERCEVAIALCLGLSAPAPLPVVGEEQPVAQPCALAELWRWLGALLSKHFAHIHHLDLWWWRGAHRPHELLRGAQQPRLRELSLQANSLMHRYGWTGLGTPAPPRRVLVLRRPSRGIADHAPPAWSAQSFGSARRLVV